MAGVVITFGRRLAYLLPHSRRASGLRVLGTALLRQTLEAGPAHRSRRLRIQGKRAIDPGEADS